MHAEKQAIDVKLTIFDSVMKKGGDHHVFGDRDPGVPCLTHDQGRNPRRWAMYGISVPLRRPMWMWRA
jgi:hypothetical protein